MNVETVAAQLGEETFASEPYPPLVIDWLPLPFISLAQGQGSQRRRGHTSGSFRSVFQERDAQASTTRAVAEALDRLNRESVSILEGHIRCGIEAGNIRADVDPLAEAVAIIGAMRGVSAQYLIGMSDASAKAVRNALVETLRRGLQRGPA